MIFQKKKYNTVIAKASIRTQPTSRKVPNELKVHNSRNDQTKKIATRRPINGSQRHRQQQRQRKSTSPFTFLTFTIKAFPVLLWRMVSNR